MGLKVIRNNQLYGKFLGFENRLRNGHKLRAARLSSARVNDGLPRHRHENINNSGTILHSLTPFDPVN